MGNRRGGRSGDGGVSGSETPLVVWGQRRPNPDWDRYLAVLVALSLREVEEAAAEVREEEPGE